MTASLRLRRGTEKGDGEMAKARRFVVWYSAQCCGVAKGGIAEPADGVTLDMWMDEYGAGDDRDSEFDREIEVL